MQPCQCARGAIQRTGYVSARLMLGADRGARRSQPGPAQGWRGEAAARGGAAEWRARPGARLGGGTAPPWRPPPTCAPAPCTRPHVLMRQAPVPVQYTSSTSSEQYSGLYLACVPGCTERHSRGTPHPIVHGGSTGEQALYRLGRPPPPSPGSRSHSGLSQYWSARSVVHATGKRPSSSRCRRWVQSDAAAQRPGTAGTVRTLSFSLSPRRPPPPPHLAPHPCHRRPCPAPPAWQASPAPVMAALLPLCTAGPSSRSLPCPAAAPSSRRCHVAARPYLAGASLLQRSQPCIGGRQARRRVGGAVASFPASAPQAPAPGHGLLRVAGAHISPP